MRLARLAIWIATAGFVSSGELIGKPLLVYDSNESGEAIVEGGKQPSARRRRW